MSNIIRQREPHEPKHLLNGEPEIVFQARIGAILNFPVLEDREGKGYVAYTFEKYVRAPGTRIIAVRDQKIYLQKEYRFEQDRFDWRLPGGKVFDNFELYKPYITKEIPEEIIVKAAKKELAEEAGLQANKLRVFDRSVCGTTVTWDLIYVIAEDISVLTDRKEHEGEHFEQNKWCSFQEVEKMCKSGEIGEGRTVSALLKYISS